MIKTLIVSSLFITPAFVQVSTDAQGHTHFTRHKVQVEKKKLQWLIISRLLL